MLLVRQTVFHGGQPEPPAMLPAAAAATGESARVTVQPVRATRDALAQTQAADAAARTTPETAATPAPSQTARVLPAYREL